MHVRNYHIDAMHPCHFLAAPGGNRHFGYAGRA